MMKELLSVFDALGFTENETRVLNTLLLNDQVLRVSDVAKKTKINRATVYGVLTDLQKKGLVSSTEVRGVLRYRSIEPHLLADYIGQRKAELDRIEERLETLVPQIEQVRAAPHRYRPSVQFYEGTDGIKQVYGSILKEIRVKKVYGVIGADALYKLLDEQFIEAFFKKRTALGVHWYTLANESEESRQMQRRDDRQMRTTKILPPGYTFPIELASYDDKTIIVSYAEDYPIGIVITDAKVAETIKTLIRYIDNTIPGEKKELLSTENPK